VPRGQRDGSLRPYSTTTSTTTIHTKKEVSLPHPVLLLLLRKSCSAGNRNRTTGSVARKPDHETIEAVDLNTVISDIFVKGHK
jgi:hypothetical protein